jgi:hypothetical protein
MIEQGKTKQEYAEANAAENQATRLQESLEARIEAIHDKYLDCAPSCVESE